MLYRDKLTKPPGSLTLSISEVSRVTQDPGNLVCVVGLQSKGGHGHNGGALFPAPEKMSLDRETTA